MSRKQKRAVKLVEPDKIEEALKLSDMELMGMWTPIVGSAKISYWEDTPSTRSTLLVMRRTTYDVISRLVGLMKLWLGPEAEIGSE